MTDFLIRKDIIADSITTNSDIHIIGVTGPTGFSLSGSTGFTGPAGIDGLSDPAGTVVSLEAGETLIKYQIVKLSNTGTIIRADNTIGVVGIVLNDAIAGDIVSVQVDGIFTVITQTNITKGTRILSDHHGYAIPIEFPDTKVFAIALTDANGIASSPAYLQAIFKISEIY